MVEQDVAMATVSDAGKHSLEAKGVEPGAKDVLPAEFTTAAVKAGRHSRSRFRMPVGNRAIRRTLTAAALTSLVLTGQTAFDAVTHPASNEPGIAAVDTSPQTEQEAQPLNQQLDTFMKRTVGIFYPENQTSSEARTLLESMNAQMEITNTQSGENVTRTGTSLVADHNSENSTRYQISFTANPDTHEIVSAAISTRVGISSSDSEFFLTPEGIVYFYDTVIEKDGNDGFRVIEQSGYGTPDSWTPRAVRLTTGDVDPRYRGQVRAMTQADMDALEQRRTTFMLDVSSRHQARLPEGGAAPFPIIPGIPT